MWSAGTFGLQAVSPPAVLLLVESFDCNCFNYSSGFITELISYFTAFFVPWFLLGVLLHLRGDWIRDSRSGLYSTCSLFVAQ